VWTNSFFRQIIRDHHGYPGSTQWNANLTEFQPDACHIFPADLKQCFARKKVASIAFFGASQSRHNAYEMVYLLERLGFACRTTDTAIEASQHLKFNGPGNHVCVDLRDKPKIQCIPCIAFRTECNLGKQTVRVEYISLEDIRMSVKKIRGTKLFCPDYLFNVYFREAWPSLSFFSLPMNHIKYLHSPERFNETLSTFLTSLTCAKPSYADFYLLPGLSEWESKRRGPNKATWFNRRYKGRLATDQIRLMNNVLLQQLEPLLLDASSHIYSFLDMVDLTSGLKDICFDGVHYEDRFYIALLNALFGLYCAE
jgi:hypothetical protein